MCKKTEFKSIDKMTREEQEAAYEHALGLNLNKIHLDYFHNTRIIPTIKCSHCDLDIPEYNLYRHEKNCILAKISLEELEQEWFNPTMSRNSFAKKLRLLRHCVITTFVKRLQEGGIMKYGDINWNRTCIHCGLDFNVGVFCTSGGEKRVSWDHEKKCLLSKISLEELVSEITNPTMTLTHLAEKLGTERHVFKRTLNTLKAAGKIPAHISINALDEYRRVFTKCKYCNLDITNRIISVHEKSCILSKISLDKFISEWTNPTMTQRQVAKKYGTTRGTLRLNWSKLKEAGMIP